MYSNKKTILLLLLPAILFANMIVAQATVKVDSNRVRKSFVLQIGGGFGGYTTVVHIKPPALTGSVNRYSAVGTVRIMWHPSYRLRMGLESGYTNFYSYKVKNGNTIGSLQLSAIPMLFVFSMQVIPRVNIYAGLGAYLETTHLNYDGDIKSSAFVLGSNVALSYTQPLSDRFGIIVETELLNAYDTKDVSLSAQLKLAWRFLQWR